MAANISKPSSVQMAITYKCNLKCLHCDIWKCKKVEELETTQWIESLRKLKNWLGPFRLDISGGEPFLREGLFDIIDFCNENEIQTVVTTNATLLKTETIKNLSQIKSLTLNISIDGLSPDIHDYLRNSKGTYYKVMDALLEFKKNGRACYITMATILMGYNMYEILPLMKKVIVDRLADAINFQALDHNFHASYYAAWFKENKLWPAADKKEIFLNVMDALIRLKKAGVPIYNSIEQLTLMRGYFNDPEQSIKAKCNTGNVNFIINPNGDVLLCWNMKPIGNIINESPEKIWLSPLAEKAREKISECNRTCRVLNCNFSEEYS